MTEKKSLNAILWGFLWYALTILMNSVSLINLSRDLKITAINWAEFFLMSFQVVQHIIDVLFYPIQELLRTFDISFPSDVKNFCFICFLVTFVFIKAILMADNKSNEGVLMTYFVVGVFYIPFVVIIGVIYYFYDNIALIIGSTVVATLALLVTLGGNRVVRGFVIKYFSILAFIITVICLANYYIITYE